MLEKFSTLLHSVNENSKTRIVLDLVFVSILTLVLVFCFIGSQGCLDTRTVYAAEESTIKIDFDDFYLYLSFNPDSLSFEPSEINSVFRSENPYVAVAVKDSSLSYTKVAGLYTNFGLSTKSHSYYHLEDGVWIKLSNMPSYLSSTTGLDKALANLQSFNSCILYSSCSISPYSDNDSFKDVSYSTDSNHVNFVTPLPPFSITTLGDYCMSISGGLFGVAKDAIDFVMEHPIALFGVILFIFVSGSGVVKSIVKGV